MIKQLGAVHEGGCSKSQMNAGISKIDQEGKQYMVAVEKKCRKICPGGIPFSPEACCWICRGQVYQALLQWKVGQRKYQGNLCHQALWVGISNFNPLVWDLHMHLKYVMAVLFVDNTDLLQIDMEHEEMLEDTHLALHESVMSWGTKLRASGGALKPPKCFYCLINFFLVK